MTPEAPAEDAGFLANPDAVIVTIVSRVEQEVDEAGIQAAITQAAPTRAQRRRLAHALVSDPDLLTSGRPEGPPQLERLIRALLEIDARQLVLPRCAHCGQPKPLPQRDGRLRICSDCDQRRRAATEPCTVCGATRQIACRDRHGKPRCARCHPYDEPNPDTRIADHITTLDPGLDHPILLEVIQQAVPQPFQRHRVLWELDECPALLTGEAAHGSPRINALVHALLAAGARNIVAPPCPSCGRTARLSHQLGGQRCCRRCYDQDKLQECSRCQRRTHVTSRTSTGKPVCINCFRADHANHERCHRCGQTRLIVHRDSNRALCHRCWRGPTTTCSLCGQDKPCYFAHTDQPRCENCSRYLRRVPCSRCGKQQPPWLRTAEGQPLCGSCARRREPCAACHRMRTVAARLSSGPHCSTCYRKHPASFQPCTECGTVEHLHHHGLCVRCACRRHLLTLLCDTEGGLRPHAQAIYQVLANSDPAAVLFWLRSSVAQHILGELSHASQPPTHATLDRYLPSRAVHHLRKILVAGGVLPHRDEHLAQLERWIAQNVERITDPTERRIVHSFASWYHLRRLRQESERHHITAGQAERAHDTIRVAIKLITWLHDQGRSLATCTQRDIDRWLADKPITHHHARSFIVWTTQRGHTHDLEIPPLARNDKITRVDDDRRWDMIRRLLHDDTLALEDRVAGLLVLLYGQSLSRIVQLTRDQILIKPTGIQLVLGAKPLDLPAPLGNLARQLAARRHGHAVVGRTDDHPWLFPGGAPGHPVSSSRLKTRLGALGIHGRAGRNTALIDLASQVPPVVLTRMLGIHLNTAATWAERASSSGAAYAAELARRGSLSKS